MCTLIYLISTSAQCQMKPANQRLCHFILHVDIYKQFKGFNPSCTYPLYIYALKIKVIKITTGQISWMFNFLFYQVLRYHQNGEPLWVSDEGKPNDGDIPKCECGSERVFEFQVRI